MRLGLSSLLPQNLLHRPRLFLIHLTLFVLFYHKKTSPQLTLFDVMQLQDLSHKIYTCLQRFSAKRLSAILKCEKLSHLLSTSNVLFTNLNVTCAMQDMLVTHLATYTSELRNTKAQVHPSASTFVKHSSAPKDFSNNFSILKKCKSKFDCLVFEMFFINELRPSLNVQSDSLRARVFK